MSAIDTLIPLIKKSEGCKLTAYQCPALVWTVGYGCTGKGISKGVVWTQEQADTALIARANQALNEALKASPILIDYPIKLAAIADLIFNTGIGGYVGHSLKPYVDKGNWAKAAIEILLFCHAGGKVMKGLQTRRIAESKLLLS
jgi:lysozyme